MKKNENTSTNQEPLFVDLFMNKGTQLKSKIMDEIKKQEFYKQYVHIIKQIMFKLDSLSDVFYLNEVSGGYVLNTDMMHTDYLRIVNLQELHSSKSQDIKTMDDLILKEFEPNELDEAKKAVAEANTKFKKIIDDVKESIASKFNVKSEEDLNDNILWDIIEKTDECKHNAEIEIDKNTFSEETETSIKNSQSNGHEHDIIGYPEDNHINNLKEKSKSSEHGSSNSRRQNNYKPENKSSKVENSNQKQKENSLGNLQQENSYESEKQSSTEHKRFGKGKSQNNFNEDEHEYIENIRLSEKKISSSGDSGIERSNQDNSSSEKDNSQNQEKSGSKNSSKNNSSQSNSNIERSNQDNSSSEKDNSQNQEKSGSKNSESSSQNNSSQSNLGIERSNQDNSSSEKDNSQNQEKSGSKNSESSSQNNSSSVKDSNPNREKSGSKSSSQNKNDSICLFQELDENNNYENSGLRQKQNESRLDIPSGIILEPNNSENRNSQTSYVRDEAYKMLSPLSTMNRTTSPDRSEYHKNGKSEIKYSISSAPNTEYHTAFDYEAAYNELKHHNYNIESTTTELKNNLPLKISVKQKAKLFFWMLFHHPLVLFRSLFSSSDYSLQKHALLFEFRNHYNKQSLTTDRSSGGSQKTSVFDRTGISINESNYQPSNKSEHAKKGKYNENNKGEH